MTTQAPEQIGLNAGKSSRPAIATVEIKTPRFTADDVYLFNEGTHYRLADKLGSHVLPNGGVAFAVWAPNARQVFVFGSFNGWNKEQHAMRQIGDSGVWELTVPEARESDIYKYFIISKHNDYRVDKADPFAFQQEKPPQTGSIVRNLAYSWADSEWMSTRDTRQTLSSPMSVYEVHLGSWMRVPEEHNRWLTYRELAPKLVEHCKQLGFTHVELLPVMEHPFYGSWGYQITGYFAPTSRYGTPQDLMYLIDHLHQHGMGVILDWVPSHFPTDEHGLVYFDGTHLFEHADRRQGFHPEWNSAIFNYGRHEVRAFLISNATFWLEKYHADGLRVDGVASMLYLDYGRHHGDWVPNSNGGRENLGAIQFLRQLNTEIYRTFPGVQTIAEESTSWPLVSRPVDAGGLGFGLKWDMGWMHDTLRYFKRDPLYRKFHHNDFTFRGMYMFSENYMLPLSHDEVVHLKGSLLGRMPGTEWQRFANLRLLLTSQWTQPGKKLLFMGGEFGQLAEWNHDASLDWHLAQQPLHAAIQRLVSDLNALYLRLPALHEHDCDSAGFEWIQTDDAENSVIAFLRKGRKPEDVALIVLNCTPVPRENYRLGAPGFDEWQDVLNTDATEYGGSGVGNMGSIETSPMPWGRFPRSLTFRLPPLGALVLIPVTPSDGGTL